MMSSPMADEARTHPNPTDEVAVESSPPQPPHPSSTPVSVSGGAVVAKTSKYDFVKVRLWSGEPHAEGSHFHVLSRFLLARVLSESGVSRAAAVRIALAAKKRIVDAGRLDVTEAEWGALLRSMMVASGHGHLVGSFTMLRAWGARRSPLLLLLCGGALMGKAALATKLAHHLNLSAMIQSRNVYQVCCSMEDEQEDQQQPQQQGDDAALVAERRRLRRLPLYMHSWSSPSALEAEYARRCRSVRRSLTRDVCKALAEGRSTLLEGTLIDPTLFEELLLLCAPLPAMATAADSLTSDDAAPMHGDKDSNLTAACRAAAHAIPPTLVSFHVTLSPARQQLLLHNHFVAAAASSNVPLVDQSILAATSGEGVSTSAPAPPAAPISHALIWRNLRWLESIIAERHSRWCRLIQEHNQRVQDASAFPRTSADVSSSSEAPLISTPRVPPSQSVSLDHVSEAVERMRAGVLEAIAQGLRQAHVYMDEDVEGGEEEEAKEEKQQGGDAANTQQQQL